MDSSGRLSEDDLDEFEYSEDDNKHKNQKNTTKFKDEKYDEALEFSHDLSVAESFDARDKVSILMNIFLLEQ